MVRNIHIYRRGSDGCSCGHRGYHRRDSYVVYDNDAEQSPNCLLAYHVWSNRYCSHTGVAYISHDEVRSSFLPVDMDGVHKIVQLKQ